MNVLMYPIAPDDDFPEMFCAIRPYDGEHQFYKPESERTNTLLWCERDAKAWDDRMRELGVEVDG